MYSGLDFSENPEGFVEKEVEADKAGISKSRGETYRISLNPTL